MRQFIAILLSLLLVISLVPPTQAVANSDMPFDEYGIRGSSEAARIQLAATDEWETFPKKSNVLLTEERKIKFSAVATADKIEAITIEHKNKSIPVRVTYNESEFVVVKPVQRFLAGQSYTLKILLKNGKKYKMDFTTTKEGVDIEPNNTYGQASDLYIDEAIQGTLAEMDTTDFYKIKVLQDGRLTINLRRLETEKLSLYLYDENGSDGDLLAYAKDKESITLARDLKAGTYYVRVSGNGGYELTTSLAPKVIDPAQVLQQAQEAVDALPAPMDVKDKHAEDINQAITLIATAKAVGADPIAIEKLEKKIVELQDIIAPLEMTASVLNATTFEVRFNRPVDASIALFTVNNGATVKTVTFNANKTVAKVEMTSKLNTGSTDKEYKLTVNGLASKALPTTPEITTVKSETIAFIEIPGNYANRITADKATIDYKIKNQYGDDVTATTAERPVATATMTANGATVDKVEVTSSGKVTITTNGAKEGDSVTLTLTYGKLLPVEKTVTISAQAVVEGVEIVGVYNKTTDKLNDGSLKETTNLKTEEFYLLIKATDQYDEPVTDLNILKTPNVLRLVQTDPTIVKFAAITELVEIKDGTGNVKGIGLPLTGTPKLGETEVTLTATASGEKASHIVAVAESTRTDEIKLIVPPRIPEGEDLKIQIEAKDKEPIPNVITDKKIIESPVSGIKFTITPYIPHTIETDDPENPTEIWMEFDKSNVKEGSFTIKAESSTKKVVTETITVEGRAAPTTWEWAEKIAEDGTKTEIQTEIEVTGPTDHLSQKISEFIQVFDQYGTPVEKPFGGDNSSYSLVVTDENPTGGAVEVKADVVTTRAIGTEEVTIAIHKDGKLIAGSAKSVVFTVTDDNGFVSYQVEDIGTIYDEFAANKAEHKDYNRHVTVLGITENGSMRPFTGYTVTVDVEGAYTDIDGLNITETVSKQLYYQGDTTKIRLTVTIDSTGETYIQDIIVSKVAPKVENLQLWENGKTTPLKTMSYEPKEVDKEAFDLDGLREKADIVATDQYGVQVVLGKAENLAFSDGTEINSGLEFTKGSSLESDGLIFTQNGTKDAAVTELPLGATFNTVLSAGTKSNPVLVTVVGVGYTPEAEMAQKAVEEAAKKITKDKFWILTNQDNVIEIARGIVGEEYTVTIKSNHRAIANDGKVTQQANKTTGKVEFTVTKGQHSSTISIDDLEVGKAPLIDKSLLQEAINKVKYVEVSSNGADIEVAKKWTTEAEKNKLVNAVATAEAVNSNAGATQLEVNGARATLEAAIESYEKAQKDGTGPTGEIEDVVTITSYDPGTPEKRAEFVFTVTRALVEDDTLKIGGEVFLKVTDAASIVSAITNGSNEYTAREEGDRVILVPNKITEKSPPVVEVVQATQGVGGIISTVSTRVEYKPEQPAAPAVFAFKVTKEFHADDILKIGTETYKGLKDAESIVRQINDITSKSKYTATASGETITLTQKVPAPEAAPKITVSK